MKELLEEITQSWTVAVNENFTNHPIAQKIRTTLPSVVREYISESHPTFTVKSSAGAGNWANIPWLSILDPAITDTTQGGIYPVYLFKSDGSGVYLSLNQGTTNLEKEYGKAGAKEKAREISGSVLSSIDNLSNWGKADIDLAATTPLGRSYEYPNIVAKFYPADAIPPSEVLRRDLLELLEFYSKISSLGLNMKKTSEASSTITIPKPFILLSGISGTGKTRFVKQQALKFRSDGSNYQLVPVRPDWHEPSDLLGYVSRLGPNGAEYIVTDFLVFLVSAWKEVVECVDDGEITYKADAVPFWLCLDEMNLAPVEQYFADYLSVIETRQWDGGQYFCEALLNASVLVEHDVTLRASLQLDGADNYALWDYFIANGISIPPNLIVAGTVNMDETTHGFSRKVIDRAFTLDFGEFFPNDYSAYFEEKTQVKALSYPTLSRVDEVDLADYDENGSRSIAFLEAINLVLKATPFELAYRALNELLLAVVCFQPSTDSELQAVWDDFLMTKVLPRIEGDAEKLGDDGANSLLSKLDEELGKQFSSIWNGQRVDLLRTNKDSSTLEVNCRSKNKIDWMQNRLKNNGFTSFWP